MKIELKPNTFKHLMGLLNQEVSAIPFQNEIIEELKPQYEKAFFKHKSKNTNRHPKTDIEQYAWNDWARSKGF